MLILLSKALEANTGVVVPLDASPEDAMQSFAPSLPGWGP
jgi:hypothetical protein